MIETGWGIRYIDEAGTATFIAWANITGFGKVPMMWPTKREAEGNRKRLKDSVDPKKYRRLKTVRIKTETSELET